MNVAYDKAIVGSWEVCATNQEEYQSAWEVTHFSKNGWWTTEVEQSTGIRPCRYYIKGNLLFLSVWGGSGSSTICHLDDERMEILNHKGFKSTYRRTQGIRSELYFYVDQAGVLRNRKIEQCGPDNPRPCGTSGTSDAEASAPPEASEGI